MEFASFSPTKVDRRTAAYCEGVFISEHIFKMALGGGGWREVLMRFIAAETEARFPKGGKETTFCPVEGLSFFFSSWSF